MNIVAPFVANTKSAELMKPRQGALYYPTVASQSTAMLCTSFANQRDNRMRTQLTTIRFRIVTAVALNDLGSSSGPTPLASDRRNRFHQFQKLGYVVCRFASVTRTARGIP